MNKKEIDMPQMYFDKVQGMSQLELERKYDMSIRQINRIYRQVTICLFSNNHTWLWQNVDKIREDIKRLEPDIYKVEIPKNEFFLEDREL